MHLMRVSPHLRLVGAYHRAIDMGPSTTGQPALSSRCAVWLGWPMLLASGWTWCIGMYLPVILLQRYGWPAAVLFTIPNVAGVILFGRVMCTADESRAFVRRHAPTCTAFSIVTIAFHVFFLTWVLRVHYDLSPRSALTLTIGVTALSHALIRASDRAMRAVGVITYLLSIMLLLVTIAYAQTKTTEVVLPVTREHALATPMANLYIVFPMVFGFLLCPYGDLSFHRAYQAVGGGRTGVRVFAMFGLYFAIMIGFTVTYALTGFTWLIAVHLLVQCWYTMGLHLRELQRRPGKDSSVPRTLSLLLIWVGVPAAFLVDYLSWFVFYGLVFPVIFGLSDGRRRIGRRRAGVGTILAIILVSLPCDWYGFRGGLEWLLVIPVALFLSVLIVGGQRKTPGDATSGDGQP